MTSSIGVIEWLEHTKPIRACLEETPVRKNQMVRLQEAYRSWVANFKGETMGMLICMWPDVLQSLLIHV